MKLHGQTIVMIPWFDAEGMKQWLRMTFRGDVDDRFMYRQVAKYIKKEFNKTVDKVWIKAHCPTLNEARDSNGKEHRTQVSDDSSFTHMIEEWIGRIESDENEDEPNPVLQGGDTESPEQQVRPVPDTNVSGRGVS